MKRKWISVLLAAAMITGSIAPESVFAAEEVFGDGSESTDLQSENTADEFIDSEAGEEFADQNAEIGSGVIFDDTENSEDSQFQALSENEAELPAYIFGDTWNAQYDVLYHEAGKTYYYNGQAVTFPDENTVQVGDNTYSIKNRETEVTVTTDETGKVTVSLTNLSAAVYQIPSQWNASYGGTIYASYKTDIAGKENVTFGKLTSKASTATLTLDDVAEGTYHLTGGVIYEKANQWSPGTDFGDGKGTVTARDFGYLPDITIKVGGSEEEQDEYLGVNAGSEVPDSFTNDLWTQYDFKEMKTGDTAKLIPRRVEEAITDAVGNNVELPHFNYEIIKGDSITIDDSNNAKAVVTAVKPGNTVVKITYDALEHSGGKHFDAVDPVNTAYVVYSVDGNESISITDNIVYKDADKKDSADVVFRSYDTQYFTEGDSTPFTLKASAEGAESLVVKCNGITVPENGTDGTYTLPLENRSNIIEITAKAADGTTRSKYHVLDARKIKVNVENKTHEGEEIQAGDTAKISFTGITMPVYKLATIYNPQFGSSWGGEPTYVHYTCGSTVYKGKCSQWDLATNNSFEVTFPTVGDYEFTDGGIHSQWWGSVLGSDKTQDNPGEPNLNAPTCEGEFSFMPDFDVDVTENTHIDVESVTLDKEELQLETEDTAQLTATVNPENATDKEVTWASKDESVAKVDNNGLVTAVAEGQTEITATAGGKTATCKVTVTKDAEINITASVTPEKIYDGDKVTVTLNGFKIPKEVKKEKNVWNQNTGYTTDIPNLSSVTGMETITFTVPSGTPSGTYTLSDGYYFANYGGAKVQGVFIVGNTEKKFYEDKMPEIKLTVVNREEEQKRIQELRDKYIAELAVDYTQYREEQQEIIKELVETATDKINNLTTEDEMQAVVAKTQKKIASVKTAAQYTEAELKSVRAEARKEIEDYKNADDYRTAEKKELNYIIVKAKLAISDAASEDEIKEAVASAKAEMDQLATDKELSAKESKQVLRLKVSTDNTSAKLTWNKIKSAEGYRIYGRKCADGNYKLLATVKAGTLNWKQSKLKKATSYKYYVEAYKMTDGKRVTITKSDYMHVYTTGGKYGNATKVTVNKETVSVKKGKTAALKVKVANTTKYINKHVSNIRFRSSDNEIATVSKNGTVKGVKKGTCYVYCYAPNGTYKTVKVTVK